MLQSICLSLVAKKMSFQIVDLVALLVWLSFARTVLLSLTKISEANGFRKSGRICTRQIALAEDQA